ncbi:helix-turn-helix transcriptional regulator [Actinoplanes sp. NPDC049548]|uniref:helix-turn-helix domain-containing protein n=1 Tax=Actinoplanes sp. NPDC049548 TaxID=3155152 RepID=UPI003442157C
MEDANPLGDYLRARRQLVSPSDVGLPPGGFRRVAGLRREEVAMLAGISADYYLRLEQGRDRHPSEQVLQALARVLQLDDSATDYLLGLSRPRSGPRSRPRRERVPVGIQQLIEVIGLPAFVEGRYFDVLAANAMAQALSPSLRVGANRLRSVFLDPAEQELYPDWEQDLAGMVAVFRSSVGTAADDPRCTQLVGELSAASANFRRLWARHDVKVRQGARTRLRHPEVGELSLRREKLEIGGSDGQLLVIYHAEPGTASARALALLGSITATAT